MAFDFKKYYKLWFKEVRERWNLNNNMIIIRIFDYKE
jgi:hypothetical protein